MKDLAALIKPYKSVSMVGMCKNAGKTTALNALILGYTDAPLGLTSVGRDGESFDVISLNPKPKIFVYKGSFVATAASLLPLCTTTRKILATTGINTALGEVVVFKALSDGFIQLAGPSIVSQLAQVIAILIKCGASKVLVDGALSRKSLCSVTEACILSTGAALNQDMDLVIDQTVHACRLFDLKKGRGKMIDGALTNTVLKTAKRGETLVVEDAGKILCSKDALEIFWGMGGRIRILRELKLIAATCNPVSHKGYAFNPCEFKNALACRIKLPVFDVGEKQNEL